MASHYPASPRATTYAAAENMTTLRNLDLRSSSLATHPSHHIVLDNYIHTQNASIVPLFHSSAPHCDTTTCIGHPNPRVSRKTTLSRLLSLETVYASPTALSFQLPLRRTAVLPSTQSHHNPFLISICVSANFLELTCTVYLPCLRHP